MSEKWMRSFHKSISACIKNGQLWRDHGKKLFSMSASDLEQVELEQRLDKRCVFERIFSRNCTWHILALKYSRYCYTFGYSTFSLKRPFYTILISEQTDGSTDLQSDLSTDKQIEPLDRDARMHLHILIRWLIHHCLHVLHSWYTNVFLALKPRV